MGEGKAGIVSLLSPAFALLAAVSLLAPRMAQAAECKLIKIAEWKVDAARTPLLIEGAINGNKVGVALDTAANTSWVTGAAASEFGLERQDAGTLVGLSARGEVPVYKTVVNEFRLAESITRDWRPLILDVRTRHSYAVILGYDFFIQADVEFDLAHSAVRVFRPQDCERTSLAYWAPRDAIQVKLETDKYRPAMLVWAKLNGRKILAALSSGTRTEVSDRFARQLGIERQGSDADKPWLVPFETFQIGDELVRNPTLRVTDLTVTDASTYGKVRTREELRDMFLGLDFLRAHRVLVAHSQGLVYFTYAGGRVFETP